MTVTLVAIMSGEVLVVGKPNQRGQLPNHERTPDVATFEDGWEVALDGLERVDPASRQRLRRLGLDREAQERRKGVPSTTRRKGRWRYKRVEYQEW